MVMKKVFICLILVLIMMSVSVTAFASYDYSDGDRASLLNDFADVIPDYEEENILSELERISTVYQCETAILIVSTTNGRDITAFADDYYDTYGFGYGYNDNGIMLVISVLDREFAITTNAYATGTFSGELLVYLEDTFVPYLSDDDFSSASRVFTDACEDVLSGEVSGYYASSNGADSIFSLNSVIAAVLIGIAGGVIYVLYLKSQLKTVRRKSDAADYLVPGSFQLTQQRDVFLYRNVTKTAKPKQNSSGGSGSHSSSSGRSHGGSRGSF